MNDDIQNLKLVSIIRVTNRKLIKEEIQQLRQIALSLKPIILDLQTSRLWKRFRYSKPGTNSHRSCSIKKKDVLRNFTKFTWKHLQAEGFNFIKKGNLAQVFSCEFCELLQPTSGRLLLTWKSKQCLLASRKQETLHTLLCK